MANFEARKVLMKDAQGRYVIPFTGAVETVNGQKPDENGNVVIEGVDTTTLLTKTVAAETYLSKTDAASTYLTPAQANAAYLGIGDKAVSAETADNAASATMASKAISDVNGNAIATTYATKAELEGAIPHLVVQTDTRTEALAAGAAYTVPSYAVGPGALMVFLDGILCNAGVEYVEESSTTISFTSDIPLDIEITVRVLS